MVNAIRVSRRSSVYTHQASHTSGQKLVSWGILGFLSVPDFQIPEWTRGPEGAELPEEELGVSYDQFLAWGLLPANTGPLHMLFCLS